MIEYTTFTLPNGLRVVHHYDPTPSQVAVNVLYNVGARDEDPAHTGMAHLFEHLMFGGSANVPSFDHALEMAGARNNAWTSNDFTNFYATVPKENIETVLWAESDRMLSPLLTDESLEVQRGVVIEEFKQTCLNKPFGDIGHHLRALLYRIHPYRNPTIGREISHIENVTLEQVRRFFFSHYAPNNAVLAIAGPIPLELARELVEKWFATIPRRDVAPRLYEQEPEIDSPRRKEVRADVPQTRIIIAYPMEGYSHPDFRTADLITDILAAGQSARFTRELVMATDLFTMADASISGSEEPGFIMLSGALTRNDDDTIRQAEEALLEQARRIAQNPPSRHEMERVINRFESNMTFSQLSYVARARELAKATIHGEDINSIIPAYRSITADDVHRVASRLLQPQRSATLIYRPRE